jgi:hypothetical protein
MIIPDVFDTDDCYVRPLNGLVFAAGYRVVSRSKYEPKSPSQIKSYLAGATTLKGVRPASDDVCHAGRNLKVGQATSEFLGAYVTKFLYGGRLLLAEVTYRFVCKLDFQSASSRAYILYFFTNLVKKLVQSCETGQMHRQADRAVRTGLGRENLHSAYMGSIKQKAQPERLG